MANRFTDSFSSGGSADPSVELVGVSSGVLGNAGADSGGRVTPRLMGRRTGPVELSFSTVFFSYALSNPGTVEKSKARRTMSEGAELVGFNSGLAPVESAVRLLHHRIQDEDEGFGVTGFPCSVDDLWRENRSGRPSSPESALSSVSEYGVGEAARDEACGAPPFSRAAWRHRNNASIRGEPS